MDKAGNSDLMDHTNNSDSKKMMTGTAALLIDSSILPVSFGLEITE